jgi:hypothetical protein
MRLEPTNWRQRPHSETEPNRSPPPVAPYGPGPCPSHAPSARAAPFQTGKDTLHIPHNPTIWRGGVTWGRGTGWLRPRPEYRASPELPAQLVGLQSHFLSGLSSRACWSRVSPEGRGWGYAKMAAARRDS